MAAVWMVAMGGRGVCRIGSGDEVRDDRGPLVFGEAQLLAEGSCSDVSSTPVCRCSQARTLAGCARRRQLPTVRVDTRPDQMLGQAA